MPTTYAVPDGRTAMAATLYSGNNSTQSVVNAVNGVSMQPDMVWIKSRNISGANHVVTDSVRGVNRFVLPNLTDAELNIANTLTSFNSNGFSLGNTAYDFNISGNNYVAWQWRASNATAVTNTAGSITSSVSANTTTGFSVVTYTGTGANATVGHGLGVAPRMIIFKRRSATANWAVYHASIGNTGALALDLTIATDTNVAYFNNTSPTSSVFTVGTGNSLNASTSTYVAYCWAEIAGFSKFGSYTGNGSSDGPFVYLGFRPRFGMIKRTDTTEAWTIVDTSRTAANKNSVEYLIPNSSGAEFTDTNSDYDILSNGLKFRDSGSLSNASGGTYIYMAFAENPFAYANAR
jgi:hypothetical protein